MKLVSLASKFNTELGPAQPQLVFRYIMMPGANRNDTFRSGAKFAQPGNPRGLRQQRLSLAMCSEGNGKFSLSLNNRNRRKSCVDDPLPGHNPLTSESKTQYDNDPPSPWTKCI